MVIRIDYNRLIVPKWGPDVEMNLGDQNLGQMIDIPQVETCLYHLVIYIQTNLRKYKPSSSFRRNFLKLLAPKNARFYKKTPKPSDNFENYQLFLI